MGRNWLFEDRLQGSGDRRRAHPLEGPRCSRRASAGRRAAAAWPVGGGLVAAGLLTEGDVERSGRRDEGGQGKPDARGLDAQAPMVQRPTGGLISANGTFHGPTEAYFRRWKLLWPDGSLSPSTEAPAAQTESLSPSMEASVVQRKAYLRRWKLLWSNGKLISVDGSFRGPTESLSPLMETSVAPRKLISVDGSFCGPTESLSPSTEASVTQRKLISVDGSFCGPTESLSPSTEASVAQTEAYLRRWKLLWPNGKLISVDRSFCGPTEAYLLRRKLLWPHGKLISVDGQLLWPKRKLISVDGSFCGPTEAYFRRWKLPSGTVHGPPPWEAQGAHRLAALSAGEEASPAGAVGTSRTVRSGKGRCDRPQVP
jgi:hypothetical protein